MALAVASSVAGGETGPVDAARAILPTVPQVHASAPAALRVVVPCVVGSPGDLVARAVARTLSEHLGQQVAVENVTTSSRDGEADASKLAATSNAIYLIPVGGGDLAPCGE
jgi:tripartite-type tricarboxylate transporter receptor subunit TctC